LKTDEGEKEIEDGRQADCKNAKFQVAPYGQIILFLIFAKGIMQS